MNADKQTKATIKDVGGFIGGETEGIGELPELR